MLPDINNFSTLLTSQQLKKGRAYFEQGAVEKAAEVRPGEWQAEVSGTDVYYVKIKLKNDTISSTTCDCPHDDPFCKHVVAVLFEIQQQKGIIDTASESKTTAATSKKTAARGASFENVLEKTNDKELREFVKTFASKNKEFRNLFLLRFELGNKENSLEKFRSLIKKTAKTYQRHGFIDYTSSVKAIQPALDILDEAEINLEKENYRIVFDACCAVLLEVPSLLLHMDDSNGFAGDCIYRSFDYLQQLMCMPDVPYSLKDEVFHFAQQHYTDPSFSDFGFEDNFLNVLIEGAYDEAQQQKVVSIIEHQLKSTKEEYQKKPLLEAKINLLNKSGKAAEAAEILYQHRYIKPFREELIKQKISEKDYKAAKALAEEGVLQEKRKENWQRSMQWEHWLLQIALLEKDVTAIRQYSRELYFFRQSFNLAHYKIYRSTYTEEEWQQEYPKWVQGFLDKGRITPQEMYALADIYITEKLYDRLVRLLEMNPEYGFANYCRPYLQNGYLPELLTAYKQSLLHFTANHVGRNHYVELRKMLKEVQKINGGKELVSDLVQYFRQQYKHRPAMQDELEKLIV